MVRGGDGMVTCGSWLAVSNSAMPSFRLFTGRGGFKTLPYIPSFARQRQLNFGFSSSMGPGTWPASFGQSVKGSMWPVGVVCGS